MMHGHTNIKGKLCFSHQTGSLFWLTDLPLPHYLTLLHPVFSLSLRFSHLVKTSGQPIPTTISLLSNDPLNLEANKEKKKAGST
jgi:hypothetical protein